jgi:uncharacterized protein YwqG
MKKLMMAILIALPFVSIGQGKSGYTASYSSDFKMANSSYSNKILALWKDFENNTLDNHLDLISDTVTMILDNGQVVKGKAENLTNVKAFRSSIKNYKVKVQAWMSLLSVDRAENWVAIWGVEDFTDKDGKQVTVRRQEIWKFNSEGKVATMIQYGGM